MKSCIWLAAVALIGAGSIGSDLFLPPPAAPTSIATPSHPSPETATVFAAGTVEGAQRSVELQFELTGRIVEVPVAEGQRVRAGDVCARLDDSLWRHQLYETEAALDVARAELERLQNGATPEARAVVRADARLAEVAVEKAKADWERAARLYNSKSISAQSYDHSRFAYQAALARLEQAHARVAEIEAPPRPDDIHRAQARVDMASAAVLQGQTQLERAILRAPMDGVILRIDKAPGELIAAEVPQPVVTMTSLNQVRVRAFVEELDALTLQPGAAAYVTVDGQPDTRYTGRVTWTAPVMGPKSQRHHQPGEKLDVEVREVLIVLDDAEQLVVGLPVNVFITPSNATNSTAVNTETGAASPAPEPTEDTEDREDNAVSGLFDRQPD